MKKGNVIFFGVLFFILSVGVNAQKTGVDYFAGKWNILVKGTPNGDAKMVILLEKKDTTMIGVVQDTTGVEIAKIDSSVVKENQATIYFNAQAYDVSLLMEKIDEDHVKGSLLGMFDAEGDRVKEIEIKK